MLKPFISIAAITVVLAILLVGMQQLTGDRINANRVAAEWRLARDMTNEPTLAGPWQGDVLLLKDGRQLRRVSTTGYGGAIRLLVLLDANTRLIALRTLRHQETPGIGDFIEDHEQIWMRSLIGASSTHMDTVTGATVTSRAVLAALDEARSQNRGDRP